MSEGSDAMRLVERAFGGEVLVLAPTVFGDERGCFFEAFRADRFAALGLPGPWVQDNHSVSARGVLRGVHFQWDAPQGKLVRVGRGRALDVVVDLRHESPTFGTWKAFEIDAVKHHQVWVPPGFGHAFLALEDDTQLLYKCTAVYNAQGEGNIHPFDPDLAIEWPLDLDLIQLSGRDQAAPSFAAYAQAPRF